jgi:heptosyltransferase-2
MIWLFLHRWFRSSLKPNPKKILVIREAAIGDVICMTPFLRQLRKRFPSSEIDYAVVSWVKNIIETNPHLNKIYTVPNEYISGNSLKIALKRLFFYTKLAKHRYDIVFCPSTQLIFKLPLLLFRKSYKIGFSTEPKSFYTKYNFMFDDYVWINLNEIPRTRHIAVRNLEMLDLISESPAPRSDALEIFISDSDKKNVNTLLTQLQIKESDELIAIAATAGSALKPDSKIKTAPPEKFLEIVQKLHQNNPNRKFFFIGSSSEKAYIEQMQICDETHYFNVCGMLSLRESAELLRRCQLLISNDSGATHLASTLRMPHIVFFGATDDIEFGPYQNPNASVYRVNLPCAPCRDSICKVPENEDTKGFERPFCLSKIQVDDIVKIAEEKLTSYIKN